MTDSTESAVVSSRGQLGGARKGVQPGAAPFPHASGEPLRQILLVACDQSRASMLARALRDRNCGVERATHGAAALERLVPGRFHALVVDCAGMNGDGLTTLVGARQRDSRLATIMIGAPEPQFLKRAINEAGVGCIASYEDGVERIVELVIARADATIEGGGELNSLRTRCGMLEKKIDTLVREGIRRDHVARLLHDLLAEIGSARGTREMAGRSLARLVTALKLDMAFIVLFGPGDGRDAQRVFSFGCPDGLVEVVERLQWREVTESLAPSTRPTPLPEMLGQDALARLDRVLPATSFNAITAFPLAAQGTLVGVLALADLRNGQELGDRPLALVPVAQQIAIVLQNACLLEESRSGEALASGVVQHLPSTTVVCDPQGLIIRAFDTQQRLFCNQTVDGRCLADLFEPAETQMILRHIAEVARGAEAVYLRALRIEVMGQPKVLNLCVVSLSSRQVLLMLDDVTHRASAAQDLRRARTLTSTLFASTPAGVIYLRQDGQIVDVNGHGAKILNEERRDLLGRSLAQACPELWQVAQGCKDGGSGEVSFRIRGGGECTVSFVLTHLGREGQPAGRLLQIQDLCELRELREKLRRQDNLALMGQMVSFIAHEIKNPLFGISSAAQVLAEQDGRPQSNRIAGAMLSEIERLSSLLEELLVFGSRRSIQPVLADPTQLCREVVVLHETAAAGKGIDLIFAEPTAAEKIYFDPARLRQVVTNIVANAIEACESGGKVTVVTGQRGDHTIIGVLNTGTPIPADKREQIFDLFYSTKERGSGLGLAICRKIVDEHGGKIGVDTTPDGRTRVSVWLPRSPSGAG